MGVRLINSSDAERAYVALRQGGTNKLAARHAVGVSDGLGRFLEQLYLAQRVAHIPDASTPKFANHEAHVEAVLSQARFPRLVFSYEARRA
jgi:hypothetical protein